MLERLWRVGEADVVEVHEAIGVARGITANTIGSALERLHKKRLARRRKVGHAYRYAAALSRDELVARRVLDVAGGQAALVKSGLMAAFVDLVAEVDDAALDRLAALIAARRAGKR